MTSTQRIVLGFAFIILIGALLLTLPISSADGKPTNPLDAIFTATSAMCVTGLVVRDTGTSWSLFGQIVILLLIQSGGLGYMTVTTLLIMMAGRRISLRDRLVIQESLNEDALQGLVAMIRKILVVTLVCEGLGAVLLSLRFIPRFGPWRGIYFSIFHSISAFCNAGFDIMGNYASFTGYQGDILVNFTLMGLIIVGGIGYTVILDFVRKTQVRRFRFSLHTRVVLCTTATLILVGWGLLLLLEWSNPQTLAREGTGIGTKLLEALFQSVTLRTAGFNTIDQNGLTIGGKTLSMILMFIGASPGSTGGGVKTTTILVLLSFVLAVVRNRQNVVLFRRKIDNSVVIRSLAIVCMVFLFAVFTTIAISSIERFSQVPLMNFENIMFEVLSALGTVGLSAGITPYLSVGSKILIIIAMFAGRIGPITLVMAIGRRGHNQKDDLIQYPEGRVMVG